MKKGDWGRGDGVRFRRRELWRKWGSLRRKRGLKGGVGGGIIIIIVIVIIIMNGGM